MSSTQRRRGAGGDWGGFALVGVIAFAALIGLVMSAGLHLAALFSGQAPELPTSNPLVLPIYVARGRVQYPTAAIACSAAIGVLLLVLAAVVIALMLRRRKGNRDVDRAARHMGAGKELTRLSRPHVTREAERLGVVGSPGVFLGHSVLGHRELVAASAST